LKKTADWLVRAVQSWRWWLWWQRFGDRVHHRLQHHDDHSSSGHEHQYTCKHHPEVIQSAAGNCPKCGMKLTHKE
jgi:uncharacterized paraquat-inducible protein A